jgi:heme exporter protein C
MDSASPNPPEVWVPIVIMIAAVYLLFVISLILRTRNEILMRERRSQWVTDLIARSQI